MICTVLGARGFIGRQVAAVLQTHGFSPYCPDKVEDIGRRSLGIVFYCIGLTADFRERPLDTVEAHVCLLNRLLLEANFDRMIYLSSTRVYAGLHGIVGEGADLRVNPNSFSDLYNLSKIMGESACLHSGRDAVVVRLSNVVGSDFSSNNFLFDLIREACDNGYIILRSALESSKDYILVGDGVNALIAIAAHPAPRPIYNVASGRNLTNFQVCETIARVADCDWEVSVGAPLLDFPCINVSRAQQDLGLVSGDVLALIEKLVYQYRTTKV
jgi:nucleoside-diphosphate-sugar epimerase